MSEKYSLKATKREISRKANELLKKENRIPAVVYGKDFENKFLSMRLAEFDKVIRLAKKSSIISLEIEGDKSVDVLCVDAQTDYLGRIVHADFFKVNEKEEIHAEISLNFTGVAPAIKAGFVVDYQINSIDVKCLPSKLVSSINVDVSNLTKSEDVIKISDIILPEGIKTLENANEVVAMVHEAQIMNTEVDNTDNNVASQQAEEAAKKAAATTTDTTAKPEVKKEEKK